MQIYVVQQGDSLYSIAKRFGVSLHMLMETNGLPRPNDLIVGQSILILTPEITHTVEPNETLEHISNQYNISLNQLYRNNPSLSARPQIIPGEEIVITYTDKPTKTITVNGFTYPNVSHELLRNTMPFLTYVSPFTYSFTKDGELIPLRDNSILRTAMQYNISPLMSLSSITDEGIFDSDLSNTILNNQDLEQKLINEVIETMQSKNYSGLILDFEYILPENKSAYTNFVHTIKEALRDGDYKVYVSLAPKTSSTQRGLLYEAHDYNALGNAADGVILMTYEWGYTYGPPMAVSPLPEVEKVIQYALTEIPEDKIFLGIPNYGYDWALPYRPGISRARLIGNEEALTIALTQNAAISYDETSQAPFFNYYINNQKHEVWFSDPRSIYAKFLLIEKYNLAGISYWNLMNKFTQNWQMLNTTFEIIQ